jgi:hypothetical protein
LTAVDGQALLTAEGAVDHVEEEGGAFGGTEGLPKDEVDAASTAAGEVKMLDLAWDVRG